MNDPTTRLYPGVSAGQQVPVAHFYNPTTGRVVSIDPGTGRLLPPTGYTLNRGQVNLLETQGIVGTR